MAVALCLVGLVAPTASASASTKLERPAAAASLGYWVMTAYGSVAAFNAPALPVPGSPGSPVTGDFCHQPTNPVAPGACIGLASSANGQGYFVAAAYTAWPPGAPFGGCVTPEGAATVPPALNNVVGTCAGSNFPIVGVAAPPNGTGAWIAAADGGVFGLAGAPFFGSIGGTRLNQPIVGIASTPDGGGYWEVASDGGVFSFGDAHFYGSMCAIPLNKPIVGIASTPDGKGYWEVASDGGIFSFGDAHFEGSTGNIRLAQPAIGMAAGPDNSGYWVVAADGGIFAYGSAPFLGSGVGKFNNGPVVGIATP